MPNTDHRMGYAPAMREDFGEPEAWSYCLHFGLGPPVRMRALWEAVECEPCVPRGTPRLTPASGRCMTEGDVQALTTAMAQEGPSPARGEPNAPKAMVTLPNGAGMRSTMPLLEAGIEGVTDAVAERPTLSPAAEWPFAGQGWRNGDGGLGAQCERVRLEKLKAAEHERWLAAEEQRKRDAITACYSEKGCKA